MFLYMLVCFLYVVGVHVDACAMQRLWVDVEQFEEHEDNFVEDYEQQPANCLKASITLNTTQ